MVSKTLLNMYVKKTPNNPYVMKPQIWSKVFQGFSTGFLALFIKKVFEKGKKTFGQENLWKTPEKPLTKFVVSWYMDSQESFSPKIRCVVAVILLILFFFNMLDTYSIVSRIPCIPCWIQPFSCPLSSQAFLPFFVGKKTPDNPYVMKPQIWSKVFQGFFTGFLALISKFS